jgi:alkylation response protein AidB-like acyl-CoA dehydrogenase
MQLAEFRAGLDGWLDEHHAELAPTTADMASLDAQMVHFKGVLRLLYDAGWMRWGWPKRVGGLGGSPLLRGYLGEALALRRYVEPTVSSLTEVLAPTMIDYAAPTLAAEMVPLLLSGQETWCQGFSEPDTGSNLAALACRATQTDTGWRVTGQKVWTSMAQYAQRCVLLTRTGRPESAHTAEKHRGITALFVDMDTPGISVRPIQAMHDNPDFCEVFFDEVDVPVERMLGSEGQGWAVAMDLLPYERSTALWHRGAFLYRRFSELVASAPEGALSARDVGAIVEQMYAFRARSRRTQHRLDAGEKLGAETSIDKVMLATMEQSLFDVVAAALSTSVVIGDDEVSRHWRSEFLYSRAATIYGGSGEIQRNIIARRLLDLGVDT